MKKIELVIHSLIYFFNYLEKEPDSLLIGVNTKFINHNLKSTFKTHTNLQ